ncbi:hypothetical protein AVEN_8762-1 [Araneus ventricosus]|uniref:Endonuclease/exonuclease/phosphatase domain-containing protein n=1 Tax=Araneus ventricosus TaxID=182803 RepID=A0A4Y2SWT2_ARAVE|nr:hypothetical protein AVEN_8762-1 [Araneus ventricosus]
MSRSQTSTTNFNQNSSVSNTQNVHQANFNHNFHWNVSFNNKNITNKSSKGQSTNSNAGKTAKNLLPDIIIVQEPYVSENKIEGLPNYWRSWLSKNNKAGIIALPTCNSPIFLFSSNEIVAIKIQANSDPLTIISSYSSPYSAIENNLNDTTHLIHSLQGEDFLLGADLNARCQSWGYANTDRRGEKVSDFISSFNGHVLNTKDAPPTYTFQLFLLQNWPLTPTGKISNTVSPDDLDDLTIYLQQEINLACRKAYKIKKTPSTPIISWWTTELEIKKKEITALKRRAQRSNDLVKAQFQIKMKLSIFKKEVLQAKRNCFKRNCTQENEAYGKFFKMAFQKTAPPTDIFSQIDTNQNGSPIEIAQSILQSLYPITTDDTVHNSSTQHPILEPYFTNKQLKETIRTLPNNKAPGNDGIDFITIKQIFKTCPSILRNFLNKCLQFQRFPTPLKEGIIVLFHKKGKEMWRP